MTGRYAENTEVPAERSRGEIESTLRRYGATAFGYAWESSPPAAMVIFSIAERHIRFRLPMPDPASRQFTHTPGRGLTRTTEARDAEYEKAIRQSWRALALVIKAKLEAVAAGITTVEDEFLAHTVLPNGTTFGDWARPQIAAAYERDEMPALLPGIGQ